MSRRRSETSWASRVLPDIWNRFSIDGPRFTAIAAKYLRRLIGARELIYDEVRYCLWLVGAAPGDIRTSPVLAERVAAVRAFRENSTKAKTKEDANRPSEFQEVRQPDVDYLAVPLHTSEDRDYVPIARFTRDVITNNAVSTVGDPSLTTFGLLQSRIFNVWSKAVSGRIKSDPRISGGITYNNFPFRTPNSKGRETIEKTADLTITTLWCRERVRHRRYLQHGVNDASSLGPSSSVCCVALRRESSGGPPGRTVAGSRSSPIH